MAENELPIKIDGLSIDAVYENFVRQIAGNQLIKQESGENLKDTVERTEHIKQLKKQIMALQKMLRKERQLNRQVEINGELKKLKKELERY